MRLTGPLFLTAAARGFGASCPFSPCTQVPLSTPPLAIRGLQPPPLEGVFDPSVQPTGDPAAPFALVFSAVEATANISTRAALYDPTASAWVFAGDVNEAGPPAQRPCGGGPCLAALVHEVPSLLFDPFDANPSRRWKVFTHTYLITDATTLHYDWGNINLFTAGSPSGPWAREALLGWRGASPLSSNVSQVLTDFPQLADCVAFTEPGAAVDAASRTLLLALGCVSVGPAGAEIRVVLLSSSSSGARWAYNGMAVDGADAARLGYAVPQLDAADLLWAPPPAGGGPPQLLLSVTPAAELWPGFTGYAGCIILRVLADFSGVERAAGGAPEVVRAIVPASTAFAGACAAAPGAPGGWLMPTLFPAQAAAFQILPSGVAA